MLKNVYPNFPLVRLLNLASVFYNTKTGGYISWDLDEDAEKPTWDFREDGVFIFTLTEDHLVTHTEGKEFILYENDTECWFVRPFFEVDVTDFLVAYGTDDHSDEFWENKFSSIHIDMQRIIDDTSIF